MPAGHPSLRSTGVGYTQQCPAHQAVRSFYFVGHNSCIRLIDPFASESLDASTSVQHLICECWGGSTLLP